MPCIWAGREPPILVGKAFFWRDCCSWFHRSLLISPFTSLTSSVIVGSQQPHNCPKKIVKTSVGDDPVRGTCARLARHGSAWCRPPCQGSLVGLCGAPSSTHPTGPRTWIGYLATTLILQGQPHFLFLKFLHFTKSGKQHCPCFTNSFQNLLEHSASYI